MRFAILISILLSAGHSIQTRNIVGSWYYLDLKESNATSLFFYNDGRIVRNLSPATEDVMINNNKKGKFFLESSGLLTITWEDNTVEKEQLNFINDNTIRITYSDNKTQNVFKRVVEKEIQELN